MLKSKIGFIFVLLLTFAGQCFARMGVPEDGKEYLYYAVAAPDVIYYGKVKEPVNTVIGRVVMDKLQALNQDGAKCGGSIWGGACEMRQYLGADKRVRPSMVDTLLDSPVSYPLTEFVFIKVD